MILRNKENELNSQNVADGHPKTKHTSPPYMRRSIRRVVGILLAVVLIAQYFPDIRVMGAHTIVAEMASHQIELRESSTENIIEENPGEEKPADEQPESEESESEQPEDGTPENEEAEEVPDNQPTGENPEEKIPEKVRGVALGFSAPEPEDTTHELLPGKSFPISVQIKWEDSTPQFRPAADAIKFEVYGGGQKLLGIGNATQSGSGKTLTYIIPNVPVYIGKYTGSDGDMTYKTEEGFYTVRLKKDSIPGYTISGATVDGDYIIIEVDLSININNLVWTAEVANLYTATLAELTSTQINIEWLDNNNKTVRPSEDAFKGFVKLYYHDGNDYHEITATNCEDNFGFLPGSNLTPMIEEISLGVWTCKFENLPKEIDGITAQYFIKVSDDATFLDSYVSSGLGYIANNGSITFAYTSAFTGTLVWLDKEYNAAEPRPGESSIELKVYKVDENNTGVLVSNGYDLAWEDKGSGIWEYTITGLSMYEDGKQNVYYVQISGNEIDVADSFTTVTGSYYGVTYDNTTVSAEKDKCYNTGFIYATLKADAEFSANKLWLDGDVADTARRNAAIDDTIDDGITLYLWRYASNSPANPAAVTENGAQLRYKLDKSKGDNENFAISLDNFTDDALPRFDEKGYEYIYYVTESMSENSGYRTVYAKQSSQISDKLFTGGTLRNVRSENIRMEATKKWDVQGVDDYKAASVTLALEVLKDGEWIPAKYPDGNDATVTITGFTTVSKEKTVVFDAVEMYDDNGKALKFRVVETAANGIPVKGYDDAVGSTYEASYVYSGNSYKATSKQKSDGSWEVVNCLSGEVDYTITKKWGADTDHQDITIYLKRDGVKYATLVVTGSNYVITQDIPGTLYNSNGEPVNSITGTITFTDNTWTFETLKLPAYDDKGKVYVYSVEEDKSSMTNIWTDYDYSQEPWDDTEKCYKATATVTNTAHTPGPGISYIWIDKIWNDDNNLPQREPVTVQLVTVNADGTFANVAGDAYRDSYTCVLSEGNNWRGHISYKSDAVFAGLDLAVVEAEVGDREAVPTGGQWNVGTIPAKEANGKIKIGYEYSIVKSGSNFTITNTPVGNVSVTVNKTWRDSNNAYLYRGEKFVVKLFQNGGLYHLTDGVQEKATESSNEYGPFVFGNLPLFDGNGVPYVYTVGEYVVVGDEEKEIKLTDTALTTETHYVSTMIEGAEEKVVGGVFTQETTFSFTNTATGKKDDAEFYVVWRDEYNMQQQKRPDASYTLYYKIEGTNEIKPYTGSYRMITESADGTNPYYQVLTYSGMEAFDANGNAYYYFISQNLNNDELYEATYYQSNNNIKKAVETTQHYKPEDAAVISATADMIPENGAIVNTIYDFIHIYGTKLWKNIDAAILGDPDALPEALIYLWGESKYDTLNNPANGVSLADTTLIDDIKHKDAYEFVYKTGDNAGELFPYPKYDEYGALYSYSLSEKIVYPTELTGGATIELPSQIMSTIATTVSLSNTYVSDLSTNRRTIAVKKAWDSTPSPQPAAKFILYRVEMKPDFVAAKPEQTDVSEITFQLEDAVMVDIQYTSTTNPNNPIIWEMPIYAPNGMVYVYFVCEDMGYVPGYTAAIDITTSDDIAKGSYEITSGNLRIVVIGNNAVDITKSSAFNTNEVTYTNTYKSSALVTEITGTKTWTDNGNADLRPTIAAGDKTCSDIKLTLTRTASNQTGQVNTDVSYPYQVGDIKIEWTDNGDTWSYKITPKGTTTFPVYSENGNVYRYTVTETYETGTVLAKNYEIVNGTAGANASETPATIELTPALHNRLRGVINVQKIWSDGYNNYRLEWKRGR